MFHRTIRLLIILALLMFSSVAFAQEHETFCGDLAEADCALLTQAEESMKVLESGSVDFSVNFDITNIPDEPSDISVAVTGNGTASGLGALQAMSGTMTPQPDLGVLVPQLLDALETFNGELSLNISIPAELAEGGPNSVDLNLMLIDGVGYIDFDALQPITNDPTLTGWGGLEIVSLVRAALDKQPDLLDQLSAMSMTNMAGGTGMDPAMIEQFSDPEFIGQYLTITRAADEGGLAVFETTLDFGGLYSDPAFQELMQQQMQAQMSGSDSEMSEEEMAEAMGIMNEMFQDATFTIRQIIDPATGYTTSTTGSMVFDMTGMMEAAGEEISADGAPIFTFDFAVNFSNQNSAALVAAPADASLFPYQMLLGMMDNMMEATPGN